MSKDEDIRRNNREHAMNVKQCGKLSEYVFY